MDDPRIRWELANPHGILIDELKDTWWSGRVFDLLEIDGGDTGLLVATESGGVWFVDATNDALPLSNTWNNPDVNCVVAGPDGPRHFFAGCDGGVIYESDASNATPLLAWNAIALPSGAGDVYDIVALSRHRLIVAACGGGLFWSEIPKTPPWWCVLAKLPSKSGARAPYKWTRADQQNVGQAGYFSVAVGSFAGQTERAGEEDLEGISIVAGATSGGILVGRWSSGKLTLKRPTVSIGPGTDLSDVFNLAGGPTSVASCERFPRTLYAVCATAESDHGHLQMILRSGDGGQTWSHTNYDVMVGSEIKDLRVQAGEQGAGGAPNNCIAVHPGVQGVFAIGWQDGTFVSQNGGDAWFRIGGEVHHSDVHSLLFKPTTPDAKNFLYIGGDGGLAQVNLDDVYALSTVAQSAYNRNLATMQVYATWAVRQFYGAISISPNGRGWISAGVQDNGNIYCNLSGSPTPWRQLNGCDGGWTGIVQDGGLITNNVCDGTGLAMRFAQAYSTGFIDKGVMAILEPPIVDPAGLVCSMADVVRHPTYHNRFGQFMYAAGGNFKEPAEVHGLFQDGPEQTYHWERIGIVPGSLPVSAAGSYAGGTVMIAAGAGRIFALDSKQGIFLELPVILPNPTLATPQLGGGISRISMLRESIGFAMLNSTNLGNNYILRLDGLKWVVPSSNGLPLKEAFFGLDGFIRGDKIVIFTATDDRVYMSEDAGENWVQASQDLPRRPHCADLRVGLVGDSSWLFLGTFGRSLWRANLARLEPN